MSDTTQSGTTASYTWGGTFTDNTNVNNAPYYILDDTQYTQHQYTWVIPERDEDKDAAALNVSLGAFSIKDLSGIILKALVTGKPLSSIITDNTVHGQALDYLATDNLYQQYAMGNYNYTTNCSVKY